MARHVFRRPFDYIRRRKPIISVLAVSYTVSGTVYNWPSGNGSGITVRIYRQDTGALAATVTTTIGGAFVAHVSFNNVQCVAVAVFSSVLTGVSGEGYAT